MGAESGRFHATDGSGERMSAGALLEVNATDEQLVAAVRDGDDRAFEALYARYRRRIGGYVGGMVGDHGRAEDVTQEVFVSALRRMRATERPIAFKPWIYEIARNACIDEFRRTRRFSDDVSFDAEEGASAAREAGAAASTSADAAVDAKQQLDDLCGAFGGLSDAHHEILVMRELEGLSYREIGDQLGMSRPSVESTLFRARRRLTEEYEDLVSGERCRKVSELLAGGVVSLAVRDERRLARHVAHCQPCRRTAYAAGVDTATLTRHRRRDLARRVAGVLPIPAFLRFSQVVSPAAEPAAGWTKALAAAAVLAAGGAGVVTHHDSGGSGAGTPAPISSQPAAPATAASGPVRDIEPARAARSVKAPARRTAPAQKPARKVKSRTRSEGPSRGSAPRLTPPATPSAPAAPRVPSTPAAASTPATPSAPSGQPAGGPTTSIGSGASASGVQTAADSRLSGSVPVVPEVAKAATDAVGSVKGQALTQVDRTLKGAVGGLGL